MLDIPLLAGLVFLLGGEQGRMRDGVEDGVVRFGRRGVAEQRRLLAMSVTAAAVVADLAWAYLVPGLSHVQHHAVLVQCLESERDVRRDLGEKAGVGVAIRI